MAAMEVSAWFGQHWFDLLQTAGIVGGLFFTAYALRKDEKARRIGNSIAINEQHRKTWRVLYEYPELARVLSKDLDLKAEPISPREELFVTGLILHLNTVHQAMQHGEFIKLEGLQRDVEEFFSLPIPHAVWQRVKRFQDQHFVTFIEASMN
jgi:hypothetical protein